MKEYYYQADAKEAVYSEFLNNGIVNQLVVLPTGTGKTFMTGNVIRELPMRLACAGRVLWLTHEENLIDQSAVSVMSTLYPENAKMIKMMVGEAGGIVDFMNGAHDLFGNPESASTYYLLKENLGIIKQTLFNIKPKLVVASIQTIINRLDKIDPEHFDMVIGDEAHLFLSKTFSTALNYFKPKIRLLLTATPERLDGLSLGDIADKIVYEYKIETAIAEGYLCELEAVSLSTGLNLDSVRTTAGELNQKDLKILDCPERNNKIVDAWLVYAKDRPTIVFCIDMEHAQNMSAAFQAKGIEASFVVADEKICPDRKARIKAFKRGEITVMCNVAILTAGFDYPDVGCVIPASPTKSKTRFLQQIGRGTRLKTDAFKAKFEKSNCIILDPTDNSQKHQVINTWSLENGKRIEDRIFMGRGRKASLIAQRDKRKLEHQQDKDERRNLLTLPELVVNMFSSWFHDQATEGQLKWLASEGYDIINDTYTKGHANCIINNFQVSEAKKQYVASHGYDVSKGCKQGEYKLATQEIEKRSITDMITNSPLFKDSPITGLGL